MRWSQAIFLLTSAAGLAKEAAAFSVSSPSAGARMSMETMTTTTTTTAMMPSLIAVAKTQARISTARASSTDGEVEVLGDEIEFSEEDEEDFVLEDALANKAAWEEELRYLSRTSRTDEDATKKAQAIFDKMFETYVISEDSTFWPTADIYNMLIDAHAYSNAEDGAVEAERILSRMEDDGVELVAKPNRQTYINIADAWAMKKNPAKAMETIDRLQQRWEETGKPEDMEPNAEIYNKLIKAYGIVEDYDRVESTFQMLLDSDGAMKATYKTWVQTMKAYTLRQGGSADSVRALVQKMNKAYRMGEEEYKPKIDVYNALIRSVGNELNGALDAEALLYELIEQYRKGDQDMLPNNETFLATIMPFKNLEEGGSAAKVETLFQIQEALYQQSGFNKDLKPNLRLFNSIMSVFARSNDIKKSKRAKRILDKMQAADDVEPDTITYYLVLKACANTRGDAEESLEAFQIALDTLNDFRARFGTDSRCFSMFLRACGNLMPPSRKRDAVIQSIFQKCCDDGLVSEFVLREFGRSSSEELQLQVLGGFLEDGVRLPKGWTRNVT